MNWEAVIGLEVHVQLATVSKIFSGAATAFGAAPNSQACAVDLAMPGTLPVFNAEALRMAVCFGIAIDADISKISVFDRKNYFYPDLPKGYQISQMDYPIVGNGKLDVVLDDGCLKTVRITRAHLEEDAGKSLHEDFHGMTGIDLNRAGTPLLEIVSEPDLRSAEEAVAYLKALHGLVTDLGISDGNMAEGSMRFDINLSIRPAGNTELGTRTETKNVNSFRFAERAIKFEYERQIDLLESGGRIVQETRLYDSDRDETRSMRSKEVAHDYRYFPEPDLLPVVIDEAYIEAVRAQLPQLRPAREALLKQDYGLNDYDARLLASSRELCNYYCRTADHSQAFKPSANWVNGELMARLNNTDTALANSPVSATALGEMVRRIEDGTISGKAAKTVFEAMWNGEGDADTIIATRGLTQVSDEAAIESLVQEVIEANPGQVEQYQTSPDNKRKKLLGFFVGQIMKASAGKANPQQVNAILLQHLEVKQSD